MDRTIFGHAVVMVEFCLNPCYNGIWIEPNAQNVVTNPEVLILVLMEYG